MSDEEVVQLLAVHKGQNLAEKEVIDRLRALDRPQESHLAEVLLRTWMQGEKEGSAHQRAWCLQMLRWIKSEKLVEVLADDLSRGKTRGERRAAAHALGSIGTEKAVAALERAVAEDQGVLGEGRAIARTATEALADSGSRGVAALMRVWQDAKLRTGLETSIIGAMGQTGDRAFTPILIAVLERSETAWRAEAARALGESRDADVLPTLKKFAQDADPNVRQQVSDAIRRIEGAQK